MHIACHPRSYYNQANDKTNRFQLVKEGEVFYITGHMAYGYSQGRTFETAEEVLVMACLHLQALFRTGGHVYGTEWMVAGSTADCSRKKTRVHSTWPK
ncbi:hypothetical protein [Planomicrobium sp. CPCC 101110]|uniref:hypothetical protein n=1 Tax=Planomicrobium sp. CPCC 101110 TaxID=2599619 RepID=UPI00351AF4BE